MVDIKFIADSMLGTLARKLRIYGFDVLYDAESLDEEILAIAKRDGRVILTSDKDLHKRAVSNRLKSIWISGEEDEDRIVTVFKSFGLTPELDPESSRCSLCNGEIKEIDKDSLGSRIPERVIEGHDRFYSCVNCGKIYWMGGHWKRLKKLSERVRQRL
ncbi:MAG: Mut7-C RNAse domain-containing protein [Candidatus Methylarchaceae archaeon HK01B]|nr:Mut7-C RNAse domain-containing protein [Candidatus Methylarchaceae archaeon HK01M]MCP8312035.1 Mut7-C RNAse domain-containing protein [Candidatus Methylarchaceae archaeon HK02M1]MCP8318480.1 Mut7-C RNAse domain-containing protein [Candidatus Methylarchaceae archaeon HK01B]